MEYHFDPALGGKIRCAVVEFDALQNSPFNGELWQEIEDFSQSLRERYASPGEALELFAPARRLYRAIGLDPTKHRPSSEALLRRVLQGKSLYKVNTLVDAGNLCSMRFALPIGFYDMGKIEGDVTFRLGRAGESYPGINKGEIHVAGRFTLADRKGPFGNPSSDSDRTKLGLETRRALFVIFAPADFETTHLEENVNLATEVMARYLSAARVRSDFLP